MPTRSSWKNHASHLLSRLNSKRAAAAAGGSGGSSLVVQAGFPTSLADLYVKNRRKICPKKPRPVNPNPIPIQNPNPLPLPLPSISRDVSNRRNPSFLVLGLLALGVVAIGTKLMVVVIMILSLLLLALEKKKQLDPVGVVAVAITDPTREDSSMSSVSDTGSDVFSEKSDISGEILEIGEKVKKKRKKKEIVANFFRRKSRRKKKDKEHDCVDEVTLNSEISVVDEDEEEFFSCEDLDNEEMVVDGIDNLRKWSKFVLLAVVLIGLLGGKIIAVALSMCWILLLSLWSE